MSWWILKDARSGVIVAQLNASHLNARQADRIGSDLATLLNTQMARSLQTARVNPTLVHHGVASAASWHIQGVAGAPIADLYIDSPAVAKRIAREFATWLGSPVKLRNNAELLPRLVTHPTRMVSPNPKRGGRKNPAGRKMRPADFSELRAAMLAVIEKHPTIADDYRAKGLSAERLRWDLLHASGFPTTRLYSYLNDSHIDTALRSIVGRQPNPTRRKANPGGRKAKKWPIDPDTNGTTMTQTQWNRLRSSKRMVQGRRYVVSDLGHGGLPVLVPVTIKNPSRSKTARARRSFSSSLPRKQRRSAARVRRTGGREGPDAPRLRYYIRSQLHRGIKRGLPHGHAPNPGGRKNPAGSPYGTQAQLEVVDRLARYAAEYGLESKGAGFLNGGVIYLDYTDPKKRGRVGAALRAIVFPSGLIQGPSRLVEANSLMIERDVMGNPADRTELAMMMADLRRSRPRSVRQMFGSNGPTPTQRVQYDAQVKAWNKQYRALTKAHKAAVGVNRRPRRPKGRIKKNPRSLSERARAENTYRRWSELEPGHITRVTAPARVPRVMAKLGELVKVVYRSDKYDGKQKLYEHTTRRPRPVLATDPEGRDVFVVGGHMRVTGDGLVN